MTDQSSADLTLLAQSDQERLEIANQALNVLEHQLKALDQKADDLAYMTEVLRLGLKRALNRHARTLEPEMGFPIGEKPLCH